MPGATLCAEQTRPRAEDRSWALGSHSHRRIVRTRWITFHVERTPMHAAEEQLEATTIVDLIVPARGEVSRGRRAPYARWEHL